MNLVAPLALHPAGARTKTTATPASAQSFLTLGKKYAGDLAFESTRIASSLCLRSSGCQAAQGVAAASISPRRSHAEIAPSLEVNVGEVLNAVSFMERSYRSLH